MAFLWYRWHLRLPVQPFAGEITHGQPRQAGSIFGPWDRPGFAWWLSHPPSRLAARRKQTGWGFSAAILLVGLNTGCPPVCGRHRLLNTPAPAVVPVPAAAKPA